LTPGASDYLQIIYHHQAGIDRTKTKMQIHLILLLTCILLTGCSPEGNNEPLNENPAMKFTIKELHQSYREKTLSVSEVTQYFLDRIEALNPELNAIISINPEAMKVAAAQDVSLANNEDLGSLFGVPILVKDNIETRELPTTVGSLALKNNVTLRDADLVVNLRSAGAIILGKTNLSEWANFRSERSSSGWSAIGGQTRNPYDTTRSPCGSSSGSAVAIAARLSILAIGTETDGSVICPSSFSGIVGMKPSIGLVSQSGIVPLAHTQDTAGPMTRNVEDAAILLNIMAANKHMALAVNLSKDELRNKRVGILRDSSKSHEGVDALFERAINTIRESGAVIVDDLRLDKPRKFGRDSYDVLLYEFKHNINQYLASSPDGVSVASLQDLIEFNLTHEADEMPYFKQEIFLKSQKKGPLTDQVYIDALARIRRLTREDGLDKLLETHHLDVMIAPSGGPAFTIDLLNGDHGVGSGITSYPAISGYPHVTLPMGKLHGLPVGLSFVAGANSDAALLSMAYAFEKNHTDQKNEI